MAFPGFRREKPGQFGTALIQVVSGQIGGADYLGGAAPLTANATTTFRLGTPPVKCRLIKLAASQVTVAADADGTTIARAMKYDAAANAQVQVSADIDLEAATTRELQVAQVYASATDPQRVFNGTTDTLEVNVVNNSAAIGTQPAGLVFTCLFEVLE